MLRAILKLSVGLVMALVCLCYATNHLTFTTDRTQLLNLNSQASKNKATYQKKFEPTADYLLLIRSPDIKQSHHAVDLLNIALSKSAFFHHVLAHIDISQLSNYGLYFLQLSKLQELLNLLQQASPWLKQLPSELHLPIFVSKLKLMLNNPSSQQRLQKVLPGLVGCLTGLADSLETGGRSNFQSPLNPFKADIEMLADQELIPGQTSIYYQLADKHTLLVMAQPVNTSNSFLTDIATLDELHRIISSVRHQVPEALILIAGETAFNTQEMLTGSQDALRCSSVALLVSSLLLILAFGQITRPLCAIFSLALGLCWSIGFVTLTLGQLNILTVHFVTILISLGLTLSIQVLSEFQEERSRGKNSERAIADSLAKARHQALAPVTTAIAFLSLTFTPFQAGAELGWITGIGLLFCYLSTLTMLPSMLILSENYRPGTYYPRHTNLLSPSELFLRHHSRLVCCFSLILTLIACYFTRQISFDDNLLHLQAEDAESIQVDTHLRQINYSSLYAISLAPNLETARLWSQKMSLLPSVTHVQSILSLEPRQIPEKQPLIKQMIELSQQLRLPTKVYPLKAEDLLAMYQQYQLTHSRITAVVQSLQNHPQGAQLQKAISRLNKLINPDNPGPITEGIDSYQQALLTDLRLQLSILKKQQDKPPDLLKLLPAEARLRLIAPDGRIYLRIFPKENIWERANLRNFITDVSAVDNKIIGTPVLIYSYQEQLRSSATVALRNVALAITILLFIYYRSVIWTTLAVLPKLTAIVWTLGVLGWLHIPFNPINFLAIPLLLGIGLVFGIESLRACRLPDYPLLSQQSAGFTVVLSGLITIAGFSALMSADHQGIASLGQIMSIGVVTNLFSSLIVLPALLCPVTKTQ